MENKNRVCGIIAEYNPFHNGHKYQLDLVKKEFDTVVVVMSGSFTQRGDVAIIDKWSRAKSALISGADLVIELPIVYAMNTAERFAFGGVSILNNLGCINSISFGSECGDISVLTKAAQSLINESPEQSEKLQMLMNQGTPYAVAREQVFSDIPGGILNSPNNILGIEYIKQLLLSGSTVTPITHKRAGADYNSTTLTPELSSASAIRANAESDKIKNQMPSDVYEIYNNAEKHYLSALDTAALYFILSGGPGALKNSLECVEGIENRIYESAKKCTSIEEIADFCSTKRYTKAKIRRIILSSMLEIDRDMCVTVPDYIRVLGATKKGTDLLSQIKKNSNFEIITKTADHKKSNKIFEKDILATDIWGLSASKKASGMDFRNAPVII